MSSADLMEDGFPHGTREGYEKGCHSKGACMGPLDGLPTCVDANMRFRSDMQYRKRVDAGLSAKAIAELEAEEKASRPKAKPAAPAPERVVDAFPDVEDDENLDELESALEQDEPAVEESASTPSPTSSSFEVFQKPEGALKKGRLSGEDLHRIHEMHVAGKSDAEIAVAIERNEAVVTGNLEKMGLTPRPTIVEREPEPYPVVDVVEAPEPEPEPKPEPADAIEERRHEVRAEGLLTELADAKETVERLQGELDLALSDFSIEHAARETLQRRVDELLENENAADARTTAAENEAAALRERVSMLTLELDVAKSPDAKRDPAGAGLAVVPSAPVANVEAEDAVVGARVAGMGLDIQPSADGGVSVRLHGGEPLQLSLQFDGGALRDVGVKIGA